LAKKVLAGVLDLLVLLALIGASTALLGWASTALMSVIYVFVVLIVLHLLSLSARGFLAYQIPIFAPLTLVIAGMAVSGQLTSLHITSNQPSGGFLEGMCEVGAGGCDTVLGSKWSRITLSQSLDDAGLKYISVSQVGFAFLSGLAAWLILVGRPKVENAKWHWVPVIYCALGCIGSLFYIGVMHFEIRAYCLLCMTVHALNFLILISLFVCWPREKTSVRELAEAHPDLALNLQGWPVYGARAFAVAAFVGALTVSQVTTVAGLRVSKRLDSCRRQILAAGGAYRPPPLDAGGAAKIPVYEDDPIIGPFDAEHTLVVFSDFECNACASFNDILELKIAKSDVDLRIVYKHYPNRLHQFAWPAATASEAGRTLGGNEGFWEVHKFLYRRYQALGQVNYRELAMDCGFDPDEFVKTMGSPEIKKRIERDIGDGARVNVASTPGVFWNGKRVQRPGDRKVWESILANPKVGSESADAPSPAVDPHAGHDHDDHAGHNH
jgi:protein-disulfide isomerase/uncharacterized membrane protein